MFVPRFPLLLAFVLACHSKSMPDVPFDHLELERYGSKLPGSHYRVSVEADGSVIYTGFSSVAVRGERRKGLSPGAMDRLATFLREEHFVYQGSEGCGDQEDGATRVTIVRSGAVSTLCQAKTGAPFAEILERLDLLLATDLWVGSTPKYEGP